MSAIEGGRAGVTVYSVKVLLIVVIHGFVCSSLYIYSVMCTTIQYYSLMFVAINKLELFRLKYLRENYILYFTRQAVIMAVRVLSRQPEIRNVDHHQKICNPADCIFHHYAFLVTIHLL